MGSGNFAKPPLWDSGIHGWADDFGGAVSIPDRLGTAEPLSDPLTFCRDFPQTRSVLPGLPEPQQRLPALFAGSEGTGDRKGFPELRTKKNAIW